MLRLNLETRSFHDAADRGWLALTEPDATRSDYLRQLVTTYGFEAPLEAAFAYTPNLKLFVDLRKRSRAGLIAQDLMELGLRAAELSTIPQCLVAPFSGPVEALGWMYVAERATLLHDRVRRNLVATLPDGASVCSYLAAYDGVAGARWSELGHALDKAARNESLLADVIHAAWSGFRTLIDWSQHTRSYARGA